MKFLPKWPTRRSKKIRLRFKEPVSFDLLDEACAIVGRDVDDMLANPAKALQGLELKASERQALCDLVLAKRIDLGKLEITVAEAISAEVISHFFVNAWERRWTELLAASRRSTKKQGHPLVEVRS